MLITPVPPVTTTRGAQHKTIAPQPLRAAVRLAFSLGWPTSAQCERAASFRRGLPRGVLHSHVLLHRVSEPAPDEDGSSATDTEPTPPDAPGSATEASEASERPESAFKCAAHPTTPRRLHRRALVRMQPHHIRSSTDAQAHSSD
jgi:hypothetical protein